MTKRTKEHGRGVGWTSPHASSPPSGSHARWLWLARAAWIVVAVATLAVVIFSVPSTFEYYRTVCTAALEVCSERAVGQPTPEGMRALQDVGLSANAYALLRLAVDKVFQVVWFAVGVLIFWRRSDDRMALLTSTFLVTFGTVTVDSTSADALVSSQPAWWFPVQSLQILGEVCGALFFLLFPSGRFVPPWTRWLVFADIAFQVAQDLVPDLNYASSAAGLVSLLVFIGIVVGLVWSQTYRYRRVSSEEQRRQTRWVVFGLTLGVAGTFPFQLPVDLSLIGGDTPLTLLVFKAGFALSFLLVPLSIGVAVLRARLFDVDVLINRTLVYGLLSAAVGAIYFGVVVVLQRMFIALTGEVSTVAVVASTLLIAALFVPLRRRIQALIDRRFYRRKYDARKTLETFSARWRDEADLDALTEDLVGVAAETMQPAHVSLWLRPDTPSK